MKPNPLYKKAWPRPRTRRRLLASAAAVLVAAEAVCAQPLMAPEALSPLARGYYERATEMLATGNYAGVIDQLAVISGEQASGALTADDARRCAYMLAMALYQRGDAECVAMLRRFADANPASPLAIEARLAAADYFFFAHDWPTACSAYEDIDYSLIAPASLPLYEYRKALSMVKCGLGTEARPIFQALAANPRFELAARYYIAYLDYIDGDLDTAYREFGRVADRLADGADAEDAEGLAPLFYMAQIEYARGRYDEALEHTESLLEGRSPAELRPEMERVAGLSCFKLDRYGEARRWLERYVDAKETAPADDALYALGVIDYGDGDYEEAARLFGLLTDKHNDLAQSAYLYLGQIAVKQGDDTAAALSFEKASKMTYDAKVTEAALYNYVAARTRGGKIPFSSAIPMLESFLEQYPDSRYADNAEEYLAMAYYNEKSYSSALRMLQRISSPSAEVREAIQKTYYQIGVEAMTNGRPGDAAEALRNASSSQAPDRQLAARSSLWLGDALYAIEDWNGAEQAYRSFIKSSESRQGGSALRADLPLARYNLAYTLMKREKYTAAAELFSSLLKGGSLPSSILADCRIRLADCQYYSGDYRSAQANYSAAVDAGGSDADYAHYRRAVMAGLGGDLDAKIRQLSEFPRLYPSSRWVAAAMLEKARTLAALGRTGEAVKAFEQLRSTHRDSPEARKGMLALAITYMETSRPADAEEVYKEILKTWPTSEEATLANEDLRRFYANRGELPAYARFLESIPGAPRLDRSDMERLEFEAAETLWSDSDPAGEKRLEDYIASYPDGRYLAPALLDLAQSADEEGDAAGALDYLERLLDRRADSPQAPEALLLKARILEGRGAPYKKEALDTYRRLESAGGADMAAEAYAGIMRCTSDSEERLRYARAVQHLGGISADVAAEAEYFEAESLLSGPQKVMAEEQLERLAANPSSLAGARAAVALGQHYIDCREYKKAIDVLTAFTDAGSPHAYWLARGFIALADANHASGKTYLAKEYLKSLRDNYPGTELDIHDMISTRLEKWKNK